MHLIGKIKQYFSPDSCKMQLKRAFEKTCHAAEENNNICADVICLLKDHHFDLLHKMRCNSITNHQHKGK